MKSNILYYETAKVWQDAIPVGNGKIGALLYGDNQNEKIILNHENLWLPVKERLPLHDVSQFLPQMHKLADEDRYDEIANLWYEKSKVYKDVELFWPNPFLPAGEINIAYCNSQADTKTTLDMENGVCYTENDEYKRTCFVSRDKDVVVIRIESTKPISYCLSLVEVDVANQLAWDDTPVSQLVHHKKTILDGCLVMEGKFFHKNTYGGSYGVVAYPRTNGECIYMEDATLQIENATWTDIIISVKNPAQWDLVKDNISKFCGEISKVGAFSVLYDTHKALHSALYNSCSVTLNYDTIYDEYTVPQLLDVARTTGDIPLKIFDDLYKFGRYLLISSSGNLPANLQGVWNGSYNPPWQCDYTMDENIEMNYWQALQGNMPQLMEPYFSLFEHQRDEWRENATKKFGCAGLLAPIKTTIDALQAHISPDWCWDFWTAGAGWISSLYYDYYLYTKDISFLRDRVYPFLKEIYLFYKDYLSIDEDGKYQFKIGISPENTPTGRKTMLAPNPTMEVAVAREVMEHLITACDILGLDKDETNIYQDMLDYLPHYMINEDGAIKEWLHKDFLDNYHHRHQSHIYPLFPSLEAKKASNEWLFDACKIAVEKRLIEGLESQTGWSIMHMANIFARLSYPEYAYRCLELEITGSVGVNYFTYHNKLTQYTPEFREVSHFQIDANFGYVSAIQEMLLFSNDNKIEILPCLPKKFLRGEVKDMYCRGNAHISFNWDMCSQQKDNDKQINIEFTPHNDDKFIITLPQQCKVIVDEKIFNTKVITLDKCTSDKTYIIKCEF